MADRCEQSGVVFADQSELNPGMRWAGRCPACGAALMMTDSGRVPEHPVLDY